MRYTRRRKTSWKIRRSFAILGISGLATGMTVNVRNMLHELVGYESLI